MGQSIFDISISFLVGIPSGIVASYIFEKIKNHSRSAKSKSGMELNINIKFKIHK